MIVAAAGLGAAVALPMAALAHVPASRHPQHAVSPTAKGPMLPDRMLDCSMGHLTNFDPSRAQTADELRYDGFHNLRMFLPAIPARQGPPPDVTEPPEPVNPRTRLLDDPDHISAQKSPGFERVVDQWPKHVELSSPTRGAMQIFYVLDGYDAATGSANLFMMPASELTHFDATRMYRGACHVTLDATARSLEADARKPR